MNHGIVGRLYKKLSHATIRPSQQSLLKLNCSRGIFPKGHYVKRGLCTPTEGKTAPKEASYNINSAPFLHEFMKEQSMKEGNAFVFFIRIILTPSLS